jgi:hypothetical protein
VSGTLGPSWRVAAHLAGHTHRSLDMLLYTGRTAHAGLTLARRAGSHAEAAWRYQYSLYDLRQGPLQQLGRHQISAGIMFYLQPLDSSPLVAPRGP